MHEQVCYHLKNLNTLARGMRIEEKLNEIKGVRAFVNVAAGRATIYYNRRWVTEPELRSIVREAGGKILDSPRGELLSRTGENCAFELCDLVAKPEIPVQHLLCYVDSLIAKQRYPFGEEIRRIAKANGVEPRRVRHLRRGKNEVSGVIDKHRIRVSTGGSGAQGPEGDTVQLSLSVDGEPVGYLEFSMIRVR